MPLQDLSVLISNFFDGNYFSDRVVSVPVSLLTTWKNKLQLVGVNLPPKSDLAGMVATIQAEIIEQIYKE